MLEKRKKERKKRRGEKKNHRKKSASQAIDIDTISKKIIWTNRTDGRTKSTNDRLFVHSDARTTKKITFT